MARPEAACQGSRPFDVASQRRRAQNVQRGSSSWPAVAQLQAMFEGSHLVGCTIVDLGVSAQGARAWLLAVAQLSIIVAILVAVVGVRPLLALSRRGCGCCCPRHRYRCGKRRHCRYFVVAVVVMVFVVVAVVVVLSS